MIGEIIDKANIKEFIAIIAGNIAGTAADSVLVNSLDSNQILAVKTLGGLAATYAINTYAEREPGYSELLGLAGLAATAFAAQEPSRRVSVEVSKKLGKPVVVASRQAGRPVATPARVARGIDTGVSLVTKPVTGTSIGR
jgi:hypothetical protein